MYRILKQNQKPNDQEYNEDVFAQIEESEETSEFKQKIVDYAQSRDDLNDKEKILLTMILLTYFTTKEIVSVQEIIKTFNLELTDLPEVRQHLISMMIKQYLTIFVYETNHIYQGVLPSKKIINSIIGYSDSEDLAKPLDIIVEMSTAVLSGIITPQEFEYYLDNVVNKLSKNHKEIHSLFIAQETIIEQLMLSLSLKSALYEDGSVNVIDFAFDIFKNADEASDVVNKILTKQYKSLNEDIFFIDEDENNEKCFKLAGKYVVAAFGDGFAIKNANKNETLQEDENLEEQNLFFNKHIQIKVDMLHDSISEKKYNDIVLKLKESGLNPGFTALFSGLPGTGKTALAKDLAYRSGRALFYVEAASIKGKYVGESEKNTQKIFEDYRRAKRRLTKTPILLFNEADAVLSKRIEDVSSSNEQMSNTMQNILLEEFERFDGILIATTNLADNLDKAFDRRFLFKLNFELPDEEQRLKIWKSRLPHFSQDVLLKLAKNNIAGGDITKIIKQYIIYSEVGLMKDEECIFDLLDKPVNQEIVMGFRPNFNKNKN